MVNSNFENAAVLVSLIEALREHGHCGNTHIQKSMFFIQEISEFEDPYPFVLYKHGPYSFTLKEDLSAFLSYRFLDIAIPDNSTVQYSNGPQADMLKQKFWGKAKRYEACINFVAEKLGPKDVRHLEKLSTALFFLNHRPMKEEEIARKIHELKPHISLEDAENSIKLAKELLLEGKNYNPLSS